MHALFKINYSFVKKHLYKIIIQKLSHYVFWFVLIKKITFYCDKIENYAKKIEKDYLIIF